MIGEFVATRDGSIVVGGSGTWSFRYTADGTGLAAGARLTLVVIGGRDLVDFECETPLASLLAVEPREARGSVEVSAERYEGESSLQFTVTLTRDIAAGDTLDFTLGSDDSKTFSAQRYAQQFTVKLVCTQPDGNLVAAAGQARVAFVADSFDRWGVAVSSNIEAGSVCNIRMAALDRFSNQAQQPGTPTVKLVRRAPETGAEISVDSAEVAVAEPGVYEIHVSGPEAGQEVVSNPCVAGRLREDRSLYWGDLHCKSLFSDGARTVDECLEYARDTAGLDFAAVTDHEAPAGYLNDDQWEATQKSVSQFNDPNRFATLLGYEWSGSGEEWFQGHLCVYFRDGKATLLRSEVSEFETAAQLMRLLRGRDAIVIPHHPAGPLRTHTAEWPVINDEAEPLVEIYSKWGSHEWHNAPLGVQGGRKKAYVLSALRRGHRLGFVGGSNSHYGMPGSEVDETPRDKLTCARPGLTAVFCKELTRKSVFDALRKRQCYATTGARIVADFSVNDERSGSQFVIHRDAERRLNIEVHGTAPIEQVDIVRNEQVVHTFKGDGPDLSVDWLDEGEMPTILVTEPGGYWLFGFYYIRIRQTDGHMAWLSPVRLMCTT
jgi:hypothetical protein